jgi:membrane-bound ClpP family serine protease
MECCDGKPGAWSFIIVGIVIFLIRYYKPTWDLLAIIGVVLVIKGLIIFFMPMCCKTKGKSAPLAKGRKR